MITSDLDQLIAAAPEFNPEYVTSIYELSNMNFATSFNCLIDNHGTLHAVLEMMKTMMEFDDTGYLPKIYVNNTIEDNVSAALQFYKSPRLNIRKGIVIEMLAAPGIDVGGIRRDFFSRVYQKLSSGYMDFFEGDGSRVRPVYTVSSLSSGILKTIGTMIGHSIIMSNIGFPLSRVMYYYMCGDLNTAIINLELDDASEKVSYYVKEVRVTCTTYVLHFSGSSMC